MKIGIVALSEAGNFGDDLIQVAMLNAISLTSGDHEVHLLSSKGKELPLNDIEQLIPVITDVHRIRWRREFPFAKQVWKAFESLDVIFFGGGGLLQTSHHPLRPYTWLHHLPSSRTPVVAVGLGLGPLSNRWKRAFARSPSPFDETYLRDHHSMRLAAEFDWAAERCQDFVDSAFLEDLTANLKQGSTARTVMGVALREWPGLDVDVVSEHILNVAKSHDATEIKFFVLESVQGRGRDVDFTQLVADRICWHKKSIHVYTPDRFVDFTKELTSVNVAVSMKLHSGAFWAQQNVIMYPIVYAPKVASLFNISYQGLEIHRTAKRAVLEDGFIRAQDVVRKVLEEQRPNASTNRLRFGGVQRTALQLELLARDALRKVVGKVRIGRTR